jgi:hypothetical protein
MLRDERLGDARLWARSDKMGGVAKKARSQSERWEGEKKEVRFGYGWRSVSSLSHQAVCVALRDTTHLVFSLYHSSKDPEEAEFSKGSVRGGCCSCVVKNLV